MRTKPMLAAALCAAIVASVGAGSAFAGEITGKGELMTVKGKSACAYSGLNDNYFLPTTHPEYEAERTQSWGQIVRVFTPVKGGGAGVPGMACNPNGGGFEE